MDSSLSSHLCSCSSSSCSSSSASSAAVVSSCALSQSTSSPSFSSSSFSLSCSSATSIAPFSRVSPKEQFLILLHELDLRLARPLHADEVETAVDQLEFISSKLNDLYLYLRAEEDHFHQQQEDVFPLCSKLRLRRAELAIALEQICKEEVLFSFRHSPSIFASFSCCLHLSFFLQSAIRDNFDSLSSNKAARLKRALLQTAKEFFASSRSPSQLDTSDLDQEERDLRASVRAELEAKSQRRNALLSQIQMVAVIDQELSLEASQRNYKKILEAVDSPMFDTAFSEDEVTDFTRTIAQLEVFRVEQIATQSKLLSCVAAHRVLRERITQLVPRVWK